MKEYHLKQKGILFMCPSDYPFLYMNNQKTNILMETNDIGVQLMRLYVHL